MGSREVAEPESDGIEGPSPGSAEVEGEAEHRSSSTVGARSIHSRRSHLPQLVGDDDPSAVVEAEARSTQEVVDHVDRDSAGVEARKRSLE